MSDDVLKIIPTDPQFVPSTQARDRAAALLKELLPDGEMCEAKAYDQVQFIDNGENLEAVICSGCGQRLALASSPAASRANEHRAVDEWWQGVSDLLETHVATTIETQMPCCGAAIPLTALTFDWPAGFARFELSIWNPNIGRQLSAEHMASVESVLGCRLAQIWAHY